MVDGFDRLGKISSGLVAEFDGRALRKRMSKVAMQTKKDVDEAVKADLGDQSMSGWRRKKPIVLRGRYDVVDDTKFRVRPNVPGPMRVLEEGRNKGRSSSRTRYSKKTGKVLKSKRWNGRTQPKNTWTEAVKLMVDRVPGRVDKVVQEAIAKHLKG